MILRSNEISEICVINKRNEEFRTGECAYYNVITTALQVSTLKVNINSFVIYNNHICISYAWNNISKLINIDDAYKTMEEAQEVANRWVQKNLRQELEKDIKSCLESQKNVPLSIQELNQS